MLNCGTGHYGAAVSALILTALGHFGARDNTAPPLRHSLLRCTVIAGGAWINASQRRCYALWRYP